MRMTVGVILHQNTGMLHSIWVSKEAADKWLEMQPKEMIEKLTLITDEYLVRGTETR